MIVHKVVFNKFKTSTIETDKQTVNLREIAIKKRNKTRKDFNWLQMMKVKFRRKNICLCLWHFIFKLLSSAQKCNILFYSVITVHEQEIKMLSSHKH